MSLHTEQLVVFVGSYAEASANGVYMYAFDEQEGKLTLLDEVGGLKNPTFLNLDAANRRLYAIAESAAEDGSKTGDAVAFAIEAEPGSQALRLLNRKLAINAPSCHIQRDADSRYVLLSSYHGGRISLVSLTDSGEIGQLLNIKQHEGSQPRAHSVTFSPDGRYLFAADLGLDRIFTYTIDSENNVLVSRGETVIHPGAGPRHMVFHPNGSFAYVINELDSTVTAFRYDAEAGRLHTLESVSTLPADFEGTNGCAEITMSADGKYLYGSNRGHDSIVVYEVDGETGLLTVQGYVSTEGKHPRHFAILPGGRFLIAANKDTNNLAVFRLADSGMPEFTGYSVEVAGPVCVQAAYF